LTASGGCSAKHVKGDAGHLPGRVTRWNVFRVRPSVAGSGLPGSVALPERSNGTLPSIEIPSSEGGTRKKLLNFDR
jgi:hypothetical protein